MAQRIVVGLEVGADRDNIVGLLRSEGAEILRTGRSAADPIVITIPDNTAVEGFLRKVKMISGVRYAEPDSWQSTY